MSSGGRLAPPEMAAAAGDGDGQQPVRVCTARRGAPAGPLQWPDGALQAQPDRVVVQTAIALMLDARTRLPPNPQAYIEALTYDLTDMGFPPAAVVAGCQRVRREAVFVPEIAEVVAACREASNRYRLQAHHAERASEEVLRMQEVIYRLNEELTAMPEPEDEP